MKYAELQSIVGPEAAQRLAEEVGGECVYLPKKPQHMGRKARVIQLAKAGHPSKDIAVATCLTIRRVQQIIKGEMN
jgi:hypothetical protein